MEATRNGHSETVKLLLERGAKVDLTNKVRNRMQSCKWYVPNAMKDMQNLTMLYLQYGSAPPIKL